MCVTGSPEAQEEQQRRAYPPVQQQIRHPIWGNAPGRDLAPERSPVHTAKQGQAQKQVCRHTTTYKNR